MQRVQNKACDFILGRPDHWGTTAQSKHEDANLEPINMVLHEQAIKAWNTWIEQLGEDSLDELRLNEVDRNIRPTPYFTSSLDTINTEAAPMYVNGDQRWF
jgi:hypothetical protein